MSRPMGEKVVLGQARGAKEALTKFAEGRAASFVVPEIRQNPPVTGDKKNGKENTSLPQTTTTTGPLPQQENAMLNDKTATETTETPKGKKSPASGSIDPTSLVLELSERNGLLSSSVDKLAKVAELNNATIADLRKVNEETAARLHDATMAALKAKEELEAQKLEHVKISGYHAEALKQKEERDQTIAALKGETAWGTVRRRPLLTAATAVTGVAIGVGGTLLAQRLLGTDNG